MIDQIKGKLIQKKPTHIIVETHGIGFKISIPLSSYQLIGNPEEEIHILTYLHVREDNLQLYGFATEDERQLFQLLISVSGIGPRVAQGILSGISTSDFKRAIIHQDLKMLTMAPGVGKKTGERLILELREKISDAEFQEETVSLSYMTSIGEEAILALVSLGYRRQQAQKAVQRVFKDHRDLNIEEALRLALQDM
jgi:Holliday junction DNA helicase RuvA